MSSSSPADAALANALVVGAYPRPSDMDSGSEALHDTIRAQHLRIVALQEELSKTIAELAARSSEVQELRQEAKQATAEHHRLQKVHATAEQAQERDKRKMAELERK